MPGHDEEEKMDIDLEVDDEEEEEEESLDEDIVIGGVKDDGDDDEDLDEDATGEVEDDNEEEEALGEYQKSLPIFAGFINKIRKSRLGLALSGVKGAVGSKISELGGTVHVAKVNAKERIQKGLGIYRKPRNDAKKGEDILFNSSAIKQNARSERTTARNQAQANAEKAEKVKKSDYVISTTLKDLYKYKIDESKAHSELGKAKKELEDAKDSAEKASKEKKVKEAQEAVNEYSTTRTVEDRAATELLSRAKERAKYLQEEYEAHREEKGEEPRRQGFDYEKKALDEAMAQATQTPEEKRTADEKKTIEIIAKAQKQHDSELDSRMGIVAGIVETFNKYDDLFKEEMGIVNDAEEKDKAMLKANAEKLYGNDQAIKKAAEVALERAKKQAEYDSANDPHYDEKRDYVEAALQRAGREVALTKDQSKKVNVLKAITAASELHRGNVKKEQEEKKKIEEQRAEEEGKKYDVEARTKEALKDLDARKAELEAAKVAAGKDVGMVTYYDEEIKKIDAQRAQTALETKRRVQADIEQKLAADKEKEKQKADEEVRKAKQEVAAARQKVIDQKKKAEEAKKKAEEEAKKKATEKPLSPEEIEAKAKKEAEAKAKAEAKADKQAFKSFLGNVGLSGGTLWMDTLLQEISRYEDDYDEDDQKKEILNKKRQKVVECYEEAIKNIRSVGSIKKIVNGRIDQIYESIDKNEVNRKERKRKLKELETLRNKVNGDFDFQGPSVAAEEQVRSQYPIMYAIKMSTLLAALGRSFGASVGVVPEILKELMNPLHGDEFIKLARLYLLSKNVQDDSGQIKRAFTKTSGYSYSSRYGHSSNTKVNTDAGKCYMGLLRSAVNVCNAQTHLYPGAASIVSDIVETCKSVLSENPQRFGDGQIKNSVAQILNKHWESSIINTLKSNGAGTNAATNAERLDDILNLLKDLKDLKGNPSEMQKKIKAKLEKINDFSSLGKGHPMWNENYVSQIMDPASYDDRYFPALTSS